MNENHSHPSSVPSHQQFLEFVHSFLSSALDLSRFVTCTLSSHSDSLHGVEISPSWHISSSSQDQLLSFTNPYPLSHSLSLSSSSSLYLSLTNLPDFTSPSVSSSSSLYPLYSTLNAKHHYHKYHMRRYNQRYGYAQRSKRRAHFYHKTTTTLPSLLGDLTSTPPSQGGAPYLNEGDLVVVYGNDTESNILQILPLSECCPHLNRNNSDETGKEFGFKIEGINPGICFVNFYFVCNAHLSASSASSHFTPDDQPLDFFPPLLRSHLQSPAAGQYLSHLFTISVHVKDYEIPSSNSTVGTDELIIMTEMAMTSSLNEEITSKEILLCSQFLLTQVPPPLSLFSEE
jgi:hypothetical protein